MIIEITGPSGVGKSTMISSLLKELSKVGFETGAIASSKDNNSKRIPGFISNIEKHNIKTDIFTFPWFILFILTNLRFSMFSIYMIFKQKISIKEKISTMRSFIRKSGIRCFLSRKVFKKTIVMVDEGLVHSAHNFLCSPSFCANKKEIEFFINHCPKPDLIILLIKSKHELIKQLTKRGDFSPRVKSRTDLNNFINNSHNLFSIISKILSSNDDGITINLDNKTFEECENKALDQIKKLGL